MKQKMFGKKLLSLGLAAAMTIASLTGVVTNPAKVKAAEDAASEIKSMAITVGERSVTNNNYTIAYDGKEHKPTSITVTVAPVSVTSGGGADDALLASISLAAESGESSTIEITDFTSATNGITVAFTRGDQTTTDFTSTGDITVTVSGSGQYKGSAALTYGIRPALTGSVVISGTPKVGETLTVTVENAPEDAELGYEFCYLPSEGPKSLQNSTSNSYTVKADDIGHTIDVLIYDRSGKYVGVLERWCNRPVDTAGSSGSGTVTPAPTPDGSTDSTTTPSTGTTTTTETKPDGTKVETTTQTKADGTKVETVTETKTDGSATTTVKETEKNSSGKEVAVTTVTEKDASGKVQSETTTSVIAKADTNTSATVTAVKDSKGAVTATAAVTKTGTTDETGKTNGAISAVVVKQITEAAGTSDVTITQTVTNGSRKFTVEVNAKNLVSGGNLKIMKLDPKTGEYVLCNKKNYAVNAAGGVDLSIKTDGDFILVNEADAKAASDAILNTVKVKSSSKTVTKGKSTTVAMSSGLNMKNVSTITYTVSNKSVAAVNKNGKVTTKKAGTVTVNAKVTLKNGRTKTVKMTIKVK